MSTGNKVAGWIGKYLRSRDVWSVFTPLALQHKSVNLGQGFPDEPVSEDIKVSGAGTFIFTGFQLGGGL